MAEIIIYSTQACPYCVRAKELLKSKGVTYTEIDVTNDDNLRLDMMKKAGGRRTVPQIFINGEHIGGFDDLAALDRAKQLDPKLV
ncbi:MAG: Glutaredoxin-related protein [Rickettsiales bacterium]|jgi:glutaredoxin 3|nr:Glutaredoxin-related protein [Rickettsiales bacterium]